MTPVDAIIIELNGKPDILDKDDSMERAERSPFLPVNAFALPAFTSKHLASLLFITFLVSNTLTAAVVDLVKTPATVVSGQKTINSKSSLFLYFISEAAVAISNPAKRGILGNFFGASGDIFEIVMLQIFLR